MEYRKLKKEEAVEMNRLQANVYFFKYDEEKPAVSKEVDAIRWTYARGAYDSDGRLSAILEMIPFYSWFDGVKIYSPGIAGVATLPEHRRKGAVKLLLSKAYEEMYSGGAVMSYLYPFSHGFYHKYGYAQASFCNRVSIDIELLDDMGHKGYTKQYYPGNGLDDIKDIYGEFAKKYNFCVVREEWRWKTLFSGEPHKSDERVLIRYTENGVPTAYLKFKTVKMRPYVKDMEVLEAAWKGNDGICGLIALIKAYEGDIRKVTAYVPEDFPAELVTGRHWDLEITRRHTGMNRVINAGKTLELMKKPKKPGKAVISIKDPQAPWNENRWKVEWEGGQSIVSTTGESPDMECEALEFSQLATGYFPLGALEIRENVRINENREVLSALFVKKPCFIWDRF